MAQEPNDHGINLENNVGEDCAIKTWLCRSEAPACHPDGSYPQECVALLKPYHHDLYRQGYPVTLPASVCVESTIIN